MKNTRKKSLNKESPTVFWMPLRFLGTLEDLSRKATPENIREWLMESSVDFHANRSATQENKEKKMTLETCGPLQLRPYALYDPNISSWRMYEDLLLKNISGQLLKKFPKAGFVCDGVCWELPILELPTKENESGYWRTPQASEATHGGPNARDKSGHYHLSAQVVHGLKKTRQKMKYPTVSTEDHKTDGPKVMSRMNTPEMKTSDQRLRNFVGANQTDGALNPDWVDWLMGFPIGWTELKPLETRRFLMWRQVHGII